MHAAVIHSLDGEPTIEGGQVMMRIFIYWPTKE